MDFRTATHPLKTLRESGNLTQKCKRVFSWVQQFVIQLLQSNLVQTPQLRDLLQVLKNFQGHLKIFLLQLKNFITARLEKALTSSL
jgi:hypothetical protein